MLIGHDWGAAAAYTASVGEEHRWSHVIALSWPPRPTEIDLATADQMRRSWYVFLFQLPAADALVVDAGFIKTLWTEWSPNYDASEDVSLAVKAIQDGDASALRHYRALFRDDALSLPRQPTLYMHGDEDGCIGVELVADLQQELSNGSRVTRLLRIGHFPQLEAPVAVTTEILSFVGHGKTPRCEG